jgi:integrase
MRAGLEDRWHRAPRPGETPPWPADESKPSSWCIDPKHGQPGTLVTTARHGSGRRWLARWVDLDGNELSRAYERKAEAQRKIAEISGAMTTRTYADPKRAAVLFKTVAEEWFSSKSQLKPKTRAGYRSLLDVQVLPRWGDVQLGDITHADVQAWVNNLSANPEVRRRKTTGDGGLSAARVIQACQVVDQTLAYAVRTRYIPVNPADHVQLPRKANLDKIALTHEQVRALAEAAGDLGAQIYVLAYAGLRFGECAALRVTHVDLARGRLRVSRSVTAVAHMGQVEGPTKTHQNRTVPLPRFVADALRGQVEGKGDEELVFPGPDGGWMPLDWFRWRFDKACTTAKLSGITPHTLRHTAGSLALASGASVITVQKLLGHRNATTTMNIYAHQLPDDFDKLAAAMDAAAKRGTGN